MRKFLIAALAAVAVLALAGIAYAANKYTVDGNTKPVVKGSTKKPMPVSLVVRLHGEGRRPPQPRHSRHTSTASAPRAC